MNDKVTVKALRPYQDEGGWKDDRTPPFEVSRNSFAELHGLGLVEEVGGAKKASEPANKKADEPANKGAPGAGNDAAPEPESRTGGRRGSRSD